MDDFDKIFDNLTSHGWLSRDEARLLYEYALRSNGPIVEVGSYCGRSACLLGSLGRDLYCIDPWVNGFSDRLSGEDIYQIFLRNVAGLPVHPLRMRVEDWVPFHVELIYLDGDHTESGTKAQIETALQCKPKYIAVHDVNDSGGGKIVRDVSLSYLGSWTEIIDRLAVWSI